VVPSRQRAVAVRLAHTRLQMQHGKSAWASCDVIPWSAWLERCAAQGRLRTAQGRRRLGTTEEWLLWREAAEGACAGLGLLLPATLAESLRRSAGRARDWGMRWTGAPTPESSVLQQARRTICEHCDERAAYSVGDWFEVLREFRPGPAPLVLAGFSAMGTALAARLQELGATFWPGHSTSITTASAQLIGCADLTDELACAAQWCRRQLELNAQARLLVIDPRLKVRRALAVQAFEHELHGSELLAGPGEPLFGIEGGQRLADYAIVSAALGLLHLSGAPLEFRPLAALLRSPYFGCGTLAQRASLELTLRERNVGEADLARLSELARTQRGSDGAALADTLQAFGRAADAEAAPRDHAAGWAQQFAARLAAGGWPGPDPLGSEEQQQCERMRELLGELSTLGGSGALLDFKQALELLRELAASASFEAATLDVPVTLTESIDDPLVEYDGIWVAGLSAESWPNPPRADPFVPIAAQRAAGFPGASAQGQLDAARQAMAAWRRCTRQLVLSWPEADGEVTLQPSHLLGAPARAPYAEGAHVARASVDRLMDSLRTGARREPRPPDLGLTWPAGRRLAGGTNVLQLQSLCPFKAVAELRLGAVPVQDPVPGLDRRERGQLLHRALELVFRQLKDSRELRRRAADAQSLAALVREASDQAVQERLAARAQQLPAALADNERVRLRTLIAALLRQELVRAESAEFTVAQLEDSQDFELAGFPLRVRMDRLDRLDDGRVIVLDYKSGAAQTFRPLDERPRQPQLLAYAVLATGTVAAVAAVHLGADQVRWRGAAAEPSLLPELGRTRAPSAPWPELLGHWRRVVEGLVTDFAAGKSAVDPLPGACQYCQLPALCRIEASRMNKSLADADEDQAGEAAADGT
jgi:ATP-dependent helicase/nuclease subunit B